MGLFNKLFGQSVPKYFSIWNITDLWNDLSTEEQREIASYYKNEIIGGIDIYNGNPLKTTQTKASFLTSMVAAYNFKKMYLAADKVVRYVERNEIGHYTVVEKHFFYNTCIDLYYRPQSIEFNDTEKAIKFCYADINLVETNLKEIKTIGHGKLPHIPAFKQLSIILEKQGHYSEAIKICNSAIKLGLSDKTQAGYEGRKKKLEIKNNKKGATK